MTTFHSLKDASAIPNDGNRVALGLFDGLHLGHRAVIQEAVREARQQGGNSIVFTFSMQNNKPDSKGTGQLLSEARRDQILEQWGVDYVVCPEFPEFRDLSPAAFVQNILRGVLSAKTLFCGSNYHFGKGAAGDVSTLHLLGASLGMETHALPLETIRGEGVSSTRIRELLTSGEVTAAAKMLGRPFSIDFPVIHGRQLGRTLGSPTINQPFPQGFLIPRFGVYATATLLGEARHVSVTNVGVKPTVGSDQPLSETYIHGFSGDLYGREVVVEFLEFIRPEMRFDSVDQLRAQIQRDSVSAENIVRPLQDESAH